LGESIRRFFSDVQNGCDVYQKNVFIMTRFQEGNKELMLLDATIRHSLEANGLKGHRADDRCYPTDRNLWDNGCTYMFGCKYGIAVLEDISVAEFNPNVALEYGFMRALGKPALLLKERRFSTRADILGTLWEEFNIFDIQVTVKILG
jgi:nucleoside 2-deoxyribosyltransferase